MTTDSLGLDEAAFTNYAADVKLPAFRFLRGGQPIYTINPTIEMVMDLLPKPDPTKKFPNNRLLNEPHAAAWGKYWEQNEDSWGCPAGLVSTPTSLDSRFVKSTSLNGMQVGILSLPRDFAQKAEILDMQHRIYGWHHKRRDVTDRMLKAQNNLAAAKSSGPPELVAQYTKQIEALGRLSERFGKECITVEIAEMSDKQHRHLFSNIASKALPINAAQIANFDESQAINRIARAAQIHPLLNERVDWDRAKVTDTKAKPSENLISGSSLVELVRPFASGLPTGKIAEGKNEQLAKREQQLTTRLKDFLDALVEAFPEFGLDELDGSPLQAPSDVRKNSLLGSPTVLRALATAYNRLTRTYDDKDKPIEPEASHEAVVEFFQELAPHMSVPIAVGSPWLSTGVFADPAEGVVRAPGARVQEIRRLADLFTDWGRGVRLEGPLATSQQSAGGN